MVRHLILEGQNIILNTFLAFLLSFTNCPCPLLICGTVDNRTRTDIETRRISSITTTKSVTNIYTICDRLTQLPRFSTPKLTVCHLKSKNV